MAPRWLVFGFGSAVALASQGRVLPHNLDAALSDAAWLSWKEAHGRKYRTPEEEKTRRAAWELHVQRAAESNAKNPLAVFGTDQWSDHLDHEHPAYSRSFVPPNTTAWEVQPPKLESGIWTDTIDWRTVSAVTPVKSQVGGTCWSFSATGNAEGAWALAGHRLVGLSEEKLIECGGGGGPYGIPIAGDKYDGHLPGEHDYPVADPPGTCRDAPSRARIMSVECLPNCQPNDDSCGSRAEPKLLGWLRRGPMSVSIAAGGLAGYQGGIITGNCGVRDLNHAVLLVGHGWQDGTEYWLVKNSWGTGFGEQGFWRMQFGVNCMGLCGGGPCQAHAAPLASQVVV